MHEWETTYKPTSVPGRLDFVQTCCAPPPLVQVQESNARFVIWLLLSSLSLCFDPGDKRRELSVTISHINKHVPPEQRAENGPRDQKHSIPVSPCTSYYFRATLCTVFYLMCNNAKSAQCVVKQNKQTNKQSQLWECAKIWHIRRELSLPDEQLACKLIKDCQRRTC